MKTWLTMLLSLLTAPALAADPWCTKGTREVYRFSWLRDEAPSRVDRLMIQEVRTGKTLQVIELPRSELGGVLAPPQTEPSGTGEPQDAEPAGAHTLETHDDLNNDGCRDLKVLRALGGIGNSSYQVYLYQPARRQFVYHARLSEMPNLSVSGQDPNCLSESGRMGSGSGGASRYCWVKGELVLVWSEQYEPVLGEDGQIKCYRVSTTTYRHGKEKTRTRCVKDL